jgi:RNA polymerase sigma-70 factor, ECF subfamily
MLRMTKQETWDSTEARLRGLLIAGLRGDEFAYLSFLRETSAYLRAFFRRRLVQLAGEVEDLVQETLLAIHNQRHTYDTAQPLTAWVHAIAKYKMVDLFRSYGSRAALTDPLDDEGEIFAISSGDALEAHIDVEDLLAQLPDRYRLPILHVKLEGLSVHETAMATGMSESAVKVGIHRGLKLLAAKIRGKR